ncbi:MAG: hypothetical protein V9E90_13935 [Saprospiraceae bacterium]|jgi:heme/copper-type cytochrome/quinol oxidase subunit 4
MNFIETTKFFFTDFHKGTVNIILHIISFAVMFYGLAIKDTLLLILGIAVIDELGHLYNYFILFNRNPKYGIRMVPYQILFAIIALIILLKIFDWY